MNDKKIYLTKEGLETLKKELQELVEKKRPELLDSLSAARNQGDLAENAEYQAAKEELALLDGRIDELEEMVKRAILIEEDSAKNVSKKKVDLGSKVTLHVEGKKLAYTVVGEWEANPEQQKISHESPLGKALMGKQIGEKAEVEAPAGKVIYTITEIE